MCIVGICGKRGTGRKTAGWLLAKTIDEIKNRTTKDKFLIKYESWVKLVILDPTEATSTHHCILESFGGIILDQIKLFCPDLMDFDLSDPLVLTNVVIAPATFEIKSKVDLEPDKVVTAERYYTEHLCNADIKYWLPIEEFIMLYAKNAIKNTFGSNVWLNVAKASKIPSDDIRIYWDVKTQAEADYCSEKGYLIELISSKREKAGGYREISYLDPDFVIDTTEGLEKCGDMFWNIAWDIFENNE